MYIHYSVVGLTGFVAKCVVSTENLSVNSIA
jgi:hypothetical protein